jgi:PhnB protein
MKIPSQYNRLMPYMILPNASRFIVFMKDVFGAEEQMIVPRSEGIIMHGELKIGESVIMFADVTVDFEARPAGVFIYVENVDETYKKALAAGAISKMQPTKMEYGYSCGFKDAFGNDWWPVEGV